jgi:hypothetical protein
MGHLLYASGKRLRPITGSVWVPLQQPGNVGMPCLAISVLSMGDLPVDIPYVLAICDVFFRVTHRGASQGISTWGSRDRYFIEVLLCLMMSKIDLLSL